MEFIDKKIIEQETETNELTDDANQAYIEPIDHITQETNVDGEFVGVAYNASNNNVVNLPSFKFDVLRGEVKYCRDKTFIYSSCCNDFGLLKPVGLVKCSTEQKVLAIEKSKGNCRYIGEHCSKKVLGHCIIKTKSYCCFPSVLDKIIYYGAREQLNKNLGSEEHSKCGGLTLNEVEKIDFSLIDFGEFFNLEARKTIKAYNSQINYNTQIAGDNINLVKMPAEINMDLWNSFKDKNIAETCKAIEGFDIKLNLFPAMQDSDLIIASTEINKEACQQRVNSILDSVFNQAYQVHSSTEIKNPELDNIQKFALFVQQEKDKRNSKLETMYENFAEQQEMSMCLFGEIKDNAQEQA